MHYFHDGKLIKQKNEWRCCFDQINDLLGDPDTDFNIEGEKTFYFYIYNTKFSLITYTTNTFAQISCIRRS